MMRFIPALAVGLSLAACDGTHPCTLDICSSGPVAVALVDETGAVVGAGGEYRITSSGGGGLASPTRFDCPQRLSDAGVLFTRCQDGIALLSSAYGPGDVVELRFELEPGTFSEWERLEFQFIEHIDPDFSGPGCECRWFEALDRTLLVPPAARRPLP